MSGSQTEPTTNPKATNHGKSNTPCTVALATIETNDELKSNANENIDTTPKPLSDSVDIDSVNRTEVRCDESDPTNECNDDNHIGVLSDISNRPIPPLPSNPIPSSITIIRLCADVLSYIVGFLSLSDTSRAFQSCTAIYTAAIIRAPSNHVQAIDLTHYAQLRRVTERWFGGEPPDGTANILKHSEEIDIDIEELVRVDPTLSMFSVPAMQNIFAKCKRMCVYTTPQLYSATIVLLDVCIREKQHVFAASMEQFRLNFMEDESMTKQNIECIAKRISILKPQHIGIYGSSWIGIVSSDCIVFNRNIQTIECSLDRTAECDYLANVYRDYGTNKSIQLALTMLNAKRINYMKLQMVNTEVFDWFLSLRMVFTNVCIIEDGDVCCIDDLDIFKDCVFANGDDYPKIIKEANRGERYLCQYCKGSFNTRAARSYHQYTHRVQWYCSESGCRATFSRESKSKEHAHKDMIKLRVFWPIR
eukprot:157147_1